MYYMKNKIDKESFDEKIWNNFMNIVCLLISIAYKLGKGYFGFCERLAMNGIFRVIAVIFLVVIAIMFWPLTLTILATAAIAIICLTGFEIFFW